MKKVNKFIMAALLSMVMLLVLGCGNDKPYLEVYNDTGYTLCIRQSYATYNDDWNSRLDMKDDVWVPNHKSAKFYVDTKKHYNDIVQLDFFVKYYPDDSYAYFSTSWHKGYVSVYPEEGYIYTRAYLEPGEYNEYTGIPIVGTTWEVHDSRSAITIMENSASNLVIDQNEVKVLSE